MRNYVIINGVNSLTIQGLAIKTLPPITKPIQRNLREEIDGRDGDIVTTLGYGAYDKTIEIGLFGTFDIDEVIAYFNQKGTITFSNEADKVYYFEALDQVDYMELLKFRTANVVLHCQPFKYPLNETPLEEEYEYVEATGTDITLDNTSEAIFNKIDLLGNTEQTTYSGKNLLGLPNGTNTSGGLTITRNNGLITFTGTASVTYPNTGNVPYTLGTGIYTISSTNNTYDFYLWFRNSSNETIYTANLSKSTKTITITTNDIASVVIGVEHLTPGTSYNLSTSIQIESGNSATSYEPYVGGIPSPNPNYPQDIHVVSGDNTINVVGKNLFNPNGASQTISGITFTNNGDGTFTANGTATANRSLQITTDTIVLENDTYYTQSIVTISGTQAGSIVPSFKDSNGTIRYNYLSNNYTRKTTDTMTLNRYDYYLANGTSVNNWTFKVQLEKGSTATDYEPYQSQSYSVNLGSLELCKIGAYQDKIDKSTGKNILQYDNENNPSRSLYTYTTERPERITCTKNTTGNDFYAQYIAYLEEGKTYTLSVDDDTNRNIYMYSDRLWGTAISGLTNKNAKYGTPFTFTSPYTGIAYIGFFGGGTQTLTMPMLNEGSTALPYEPYGSGKWYLHKEIGKVVLNGSENWTKSSNTNVNRYYIPGTFINTILNVNTIDLISDYFTCITPIQSDAYNVGLSKLNNTSIMANFSLSDTSFDTLQKFKTWLSTHNTIVYYVLATSTNTLIEDTTLIEQLEELKNATSYKGQTNISQTNNDLPFILDLSALKENSDHLVIDNIGNIYSKPTLDLEGTGIVDIYLNDTQMFEVDLSEKNEIVIDTEKMEAYNPTDNTLANRQVTGDYSKFKLDSGENDLRFSGDLSKATITNYERYL